jgi:hypothetical protein
MGISHLGSSMTTEQPTKDAPLFLQGERHKRSDTFIVP